MHKPLPDPELERLLGPARPHLPARGDFGERYFRICRAIGLVEDEERESAWIAVRRLLSAPRIGELVRRVQRFEAGVSRLRSRDRPDLILLLLYSKGRLGRVGEPIRGTTRVLKLLFLAAKELGASNLVRPAYQFVPYRFGPFAAAVYDDLDVLIRAGLVRRTEVDEDNEPVIRADARVDERLAGNGVNVVYHLSGRGRRFAEALLRDAGRRKPGLEPGLAMLKARLGSLPLSELLRYIYTRYPEYTTESEILKKVLARPADE
jgi:uncharacterized protein